MKQDEEMEKMKKTKSKDKGVGLIKKFGLLGFFFFLGKGLVWIAIFLGAGSLFTEC